MIRETVRTPVAALRWGWRAGADGFILAIRKLVAGVVMASRLARTNAVTVGDVLDGHKLLEISSMSHSYGHRRIIRL